MSTDVQRLELIVDTQDTYLDSSSVFYIHPERLGMVKCLSDKIFDEVLIKNSNVDCLSAMNFSYMLRKMKVNATLEVIISQPLSVMQSYDAKQVEANAKLAGFDEFQTENTEYFDAKTNKKYKTLLVRAVRPVRNPNEIEIEVVQTNTTSKGKDGKTNTSSKVTMNKKK